jgi:hypothetical protein
MPPCITIKAANMQKTDRLEKQPMRDSPKKKGCEMQFGSRVKRNFVMNCLVLLVPEAVLAAVIASYFEAGSLGFWVVLPGILLLYLIL